MADLSHPSFLPSPRSHILIRYPLAGDSLGFPPWGTTRYVDRAEGVTALAREGLPAGDENTPGSWAIARYQ